MLIIDSIRVVPLLGIPTIKCFVNYFFVFKLRFALFDSISNKLDFFINEF